MHHLLLHFLSRARNIRFGLTVPTFQFAAIGLCLVLMTACEKDTQIVYKVKNLSNAPLKIIYCDYFNQADTDTIVVNVSQAVTIASHNHGFGSVSSYKEKKDTLNYLDLLEIYQHDSLQATGNYFLASRWSYVQTSDQYATYYLYIREEDF